MIIYDEAQELTDEQQAASLFAISASRKHNTQTIYIGTPPEPSCPGEVFRRLHDDAHAQAPQAIPWMEWAVTEIGDVTDRVRWRRVNPSQGILIDETAIEGELGTLADTFARERLGWWSPVARAEKAIPDRAWDASSIDGIGDRFRAKTALAVKFSPDGSSSRPRRLQARRQGEGGCRARRAGQHGPAGRRRSHRRSTSGDRRSRWSSSTG